MQKHLREDSRLWEYEVLGELGRGEYGTVFKVRRGREVFALKKINIASSHEKEKLQAFREVKALRLVQHPAVVQYYDSFLSMDNIYIVMEYAEKGDFAQILRSRRAQQKPYSEGELWQMFGALANGLKYLHERNLVHRDLKLENLFLTADNQIKIGDLGMSKLLSSAGDLISTRVGTPIYFAPEIIQHQLYSFSVDVWALGCIFYALATLYHPFRDATIETLAYYVIDHDPRPIKGQYSGKMVNFIGCLLQKDAKLRPTIFDVALKIKNRDDIHI